MLLSTLSIPLSVGPKLSNVYDPLTRLLCFLWTLRFIIASDPAGVKWINKDLGQLALTPSAFSSSSVYNDRPEYQAHKANLVVFASQEESSGAWCPAVAVQNRLTEWLQVDFGTLKLMRILFTEGRASTPNAFVPSFLIRYQREDGQRWYDYRMRNGSKLLHANHNAQTVATRLDPPIVAKRFRLYPYNELEPRLMCLRLAVYGEAFDDGVVDYTIPEGDIYRMDPRLHVPLNDSSYDGWWTTAPGPNLGSSSGADPATPSVAVSSVGLDRRAYLRGGLGLLMDKQYYEGALPEPAGSHNVVGWFRRQHSTPSGHVQLLFTFDQVRNFTSARVHVLNSLNYVAVFRRALVQFSVGGEHFDRHATPALLDVRRDTHNRQARWVDIPLQHRVGRVLRITLWFDYDWIVLSEISFTSAPLLEHTVPLEKASDPVRQIPEVDLAELSARDSSLAGPVDVITTPSSAEAIPAAVVPSRSPPFVQRQEDGPSNPSGSSRDRTVDASVDRVPIEASVSSAARQSRSSNTPYIIAIVCCCLGSVAFASLFVFMVYRLRRYRRKRAKKLRKNQLPSSSISDSVKHQHQHHHQQQQQQYHFPAASQQQQQQQQHQFLLANSQTASMFPVTCANSVAMPPTSTLGPLYPNNSFQYNQLKTHTTPSFGGPHHSQFKAADGGSFATLNSPNHALNTPLLAPQNLGTLSPMSSEQMVSANYKPITAQLDQESLFALQLLQHASNPSSNISSLGGLTLARRGVPDASAFVSYPLVSVSPAGMLNLVTTSNTCPTGTLGNTNTMAKLSFRPPPPPDQPLPPLPPPSTSPDGSQQPTTRSLLVGTPVAPYAASYPVDNGLLLPFDGSMPEYASASLFSGNGSVRQSSTLNSDQVEPGRTKGVTGETYCVPHQSGLHQHFAPLWSTTANPNLTGTLANGHASAAVAAAAAAAAATTAAPPLLANCGLGLSNQSDAFTSSLDSSGMYYLANQPSDCMQLNTNGLIPLTESQTFFLPSFVAQPTQQQQQQQQQLSQHPGNANVFPYSSQVRHNLLDLGRSGELTHRPECGLHGISHQADVAPPDSPVLLPVATTKGKPNSDPSVGS